MTTPLDSYKQLIDTFTELSGSVYAAWVREKRPWPDLPENDAINAVISTLTDPQREVLAALLDTAYRGGVHDLLARLNDEIALRGLRITRDGCDLPVEPFGTTLYYDWVSRLAGDDWPEPLDDTPTP